jgi:hypothetical protein
VDLGRRPPVQVAVVALPQAPVEQRLPVGEGQLDGLDGPAEVGREHGVDPVVAPTGAELQGEGAAALGQAPREPPGGEAEVVVLAPRVGLEDQLDAHP